MGLLTGDEEEEGFCLDLATESWSQQVLVLLELAYAKRVRKGEVVFWVCESNSIYASAVFAHVVIRSFLFLVAQLGQYFD